MKNLNTLQKALIAGVVVAAFGLAGCEADGNGLESGGIIGDGSDNGGLGANDGSTPTTEIGRAHVCTPVTNAPLVCRLLLEKNKHSNKRGDMTKLSRNATTTT